PGPGLVDKHQAPRFDLALILRPLRAPAGDVRTVAFAGDDAFFEAEILGVDELPHRPVIDLQPAFGEFGDQPAQGEVPYLGAFQQPITMLPEIAFGLCPPIWPGAKLPVARKRRTQRIAVL